MTADDPIIEEVEISGHIIDSLILPKVLDTITAGGGKFRITKIAIGQARHDPSYAVIEVRAPRRRADATNPRPDRRPRRRPDHQQDCRLVDADMDGAFPEGFYSTTNQRTEIRLDGHWIEVADQEMDCGVVVETGQVRAGASDSHRNSPCCIPMTEVRRGMPIVVGHAGVRVIPVERTAVRSDFTFMTSGVSTEKPKGALVREIARDLVTNRRGGGKTLIVGGPAIVHTGSGPPSANSSAAATSTNSSPATPWPRTTSSSRSSAPASASTSPTPASPKPATSITCGRSTASAAAARSAARSIKACSRPASCTSA